MPAGQQGRCRRQGNGQDTMQAMCSTAAVPSPPPTRLFVALQLQQRVRPVGVQGGRQLGVGPLCRCLRSACRGCARRLGLRRSGARGLLGCRRLFQGSQGLCVALDRRCTVSSLKQGIASLLQLGGSSCAGPLRRACERRGGAGARPAAAAIPYICDLRLCVAVPIGALCWASGARVAAASTSSRVRRCSAAARGSKLLFVVFDLTLPQC